MPRGTQPLFRGGCSLLIPVTLTSGCRDVGMSGCRGVILPTCVIARNCLRETRRYLEGFGLELFF